MRDLVIVPIESRTEGAESGIGLEWQFTLIFTVRRGEIVAARGHLNR